MAIGKERKKELIEIGTEDLDKSKSLVFANFSGTNVGDINGLRSELKSIGSRLRVIKKRLLGVVFKNKGVDFDFSQLEGPVGTVFVGGELSETAGSLYRFSQNRESFKLLGGYDLENKQVIDVKTINLLGSLPPRKVLLSQVIGAIAGPLRAFLYILNAKSKQN